MPVVYKKFGTDSLKTLKELKVDIVKKANNPFRWSRKGRPSLLSKCAGDSGGYVFTEEILTLVPFSKVFATGPGLL